MKEKALIYLENESKKLGYEYLDLCFELNTITLAIRKAQIEQEQDILDYLKNKIKEED